LVTVAISALKGLENTIGGVEAGGKRIVETVNSLSAIDERNSQLNAQLTALVSTLDEAVKKQSTAIAQVDTLLTQTTADISSAAAEIAKSHREAAQAIDRSTQALADTSVRHTQGIDDQLKAARGASSKLVGAVVDLADVIAEKLA
jgi:hypothetical protein